MNKKGFTLVEIIVSISLVSVVMIFLFQVITTIKSIYDKQNNKNDTKITVAVITREVERDLSSFGLEATPIICDKEEIKKNNIISKTVNENSLKCIKLIYDGNNVKNNEGYVIYYQNNNKYFLGYKRGKGNIIETQTVREINVEPSNDAIDIINKETGNMKSIKITLPIRDNNDKYDLVVNYLSGDDNLGKNVSVNAVNGDLISITGIGKYKKGENVTITFNFDSTLYELANVSCTNITCAKNQTISFIMPDGEVKITAELKIKSKSFAEDSWKIIAAVAKNNNLTAYSVGDEKEVSINGTNYTVRIANITTPSECNNAGFSQTACGFVVEFVDILEERGMNDTATNAGGWKDSKIRTYANGDFLQKLPSDLQNVIISTDVISGGSGDANVLSNDKIYLLSAHEVLENNTDHDAAYNQTRQLDYYKLKGVKTDNYSGAIKQLDNTDSCWWLRTADSNKKVNNIFLLINDDGSWGSDFANSSTGFAPAFRIG